MAPSSLLPTSLNISHFGVKRPTEEFYFDVPQLVLKVLKSWCEVLTVSWSSWESPEVWNDCFRSYLRPVLWAVSCKEVQLVSSVWWWTSLLHINNTIHFLSGLRRIVQRRNDEDNLQQTTSLSPSSSHPMSVGVLFSQFIVTESCSK